MAWLNPATEQWEPDPGVPYYKRPGVTLPQAMAGRQLMPIQNDTSLEAAFPGSVDAQGNIYYLPLPPESGPTSASGLGSLYYGQGGRSAPTTPPPGAQTPIGRYVIGPDGKPQIELAPGALDTYHTSRGGGSNFGDSLVKAVASMMIGGGLAGGLGGLAQGATTAGAADASAAAAMGGNAADWASLGNMGSIGNTLGNAYQGLQQGISNVTAPITNTVGKGIDLLKGGLGDLAGQVGVPVTPDQLGVQPFGDVTMPVGVGADAYPGMAPDPYDPWASGYNVTSPAASPNLNLQDPWAGNLTSQGGPLQGLNLSGLPSLDLGTVAPGSAVSPYDTGGGTDTMNPQPIPSGPVQLPGAASKLPIARVIQAALKGEMPSLDDALSVGGAVLPTLAGILGANKTADVEAQKVQALKDLAGQYMAMGEPSRQRYEWSYAPGFLPPEIGTAIDTANKSGLAALSATGGNPYGNPGGLAELNKYVTGNVILPQLNAYRNQNAATGGYGAFNTAAPGLSGSAISNTGAGSADLYNALGLGAQRLLNPQPSIADLLKGLGGLIKTDMG